MLIAQYSSSAIPPLLQPTSTVGTTRDAPTGSDKSRAQNPQDTVSLSEAGKSLSKNKEAVPNELSQEELKILQSLKARDREVKTHEQAHLAAAGGHARGGASFTSQKGPDGNSYAVAGEVSIDMSAGNTPEATVEKMNTIRRAALAPASPSSTDRRVASQATAKAQQAEMEIAKQHLENSTMKTDEDGAPNNSSTQAQVSSIANESQTIAHLMVNAYSAQSDSPLQHKSIVA